MTRLVTLISLAKYDGGLHNVTIDDDDATVEAITEAAIQLLLRYSMVEGDRLTVDTIEAAA